MKKEFMLCMSILGIGCTMAYANPREETPQKRVVNSRPATVVEAFIDASEHTDGRLLEQILHNDAFVSVARGNKMIKHSKTAIVDFYKRLGVSSLNCEHDYEVLSSSSSAVVVRVDFKYPLFLQKNFLTIEKDDQGVWMISKVNTFNEDH